MNELKAKRNVVPCIPITSNSTGRYFNEKMKGMFEEIFGCKKINKVKMLILALGGGKCRLQNLFAL